MAGLTVDWGVVSAILIALAGLITALTARKKAKILGDVTAANLAEKVVRMTDQKLEEMAREMHECISELAILRREVASLRKENIQLKDGVNRLCYQLKSMGQTPVWDPSLLDCAFVSEGE